MRSTTARASPSLGNARRETRVAPAPLASCRLGARAPRPGPCARVRASRRRGVGVLAQQRGKRLHAFLAVHARVVGDQHQAAGGLVRRDRVAKAPNGRLHGGSREVRSVSRRGARRPRAERSGHRTRFRSSPFRRRRVVRDHSAGRGAREIRVGARGDAVAAARLRSASVASVFARVSRRDRAHRDARVEALSPPTHGVGGRAVRVRPRVRRPRRRSSGGGGHRVRREGSCQASRARVFGGRRLHRRRAAARRARGVLRDPPPTRPRPRTRSWSRSRPRRARCGNVCAGNAVARGGACARRAATPRRRSRSRSRRSPRAWTRSEPGSRVSGSSGSETEKLKSRRRRRVRRGDALACNLIAGGGVAAETTWRVLFPKHFAVIAALKNEGAARARRTRRCARRGARGRGDRASIRRRSASRDRLRQTRDPDRRARVRRVR